MRNCLVINTDHTAFHYSGLPKQVSHLMLLSTTKFCLKLTVNCATKTLKCWSKIASVSITSGQIIYWNSMCGMHGEDGVVGG